MSARLTVFTCSIYPDVTRIWFSCVKENVSNGDLEVVIYDSSGLLDRQYFSGATIIKYPNVEHGKKIDHFVLNELKTEYFFLLDDDAFIMSPKVIDYGVTWLSNAWANAIVSFKPRPWWRLNVNGAEHVPMGSYALIVKAAVIKENKLSFTSRKTDQAYIRNGSGYYDTADFINEFILQNDYRVSIAANDLQDHVITFFGTSSGLLTFYEKVWFFKKRRRRGIETIKNIIMSDTYNLQRAMSIIFVNRLYCKLFQDIPCYGDFLSLEDLRRIVEVSGNQKFIAFYGEALIRHLDIEKGILNSLL